MDDITVGASVAFDLDATAESQAASDAQAAQEAARALASRPAGVAKLAAKVKHRWIVEQVLGGDDDLLGAIRKMQQAGSVRASAPVAVKPADKAKHRWVVEQVLGALSEDDDVIEIFGAAEDAATYASLVSDLVRTAGGVASSEMAKKEEAKRKSEEETKFKAAKQAAEEAQKKADELRRKIAFAELDLQKAQASGNKAAAAAAQQTLSQLQVELRFAQEEVMKAGGYGGGGYSGGYDQQRYQQQYQQQSGGVPQWVWYALGGVGVLGVGVVGYKLFSK